MIVKVALVAAAVGPVILVIGKVVSIVGAAVSAFSAVSGAISAAGGVIAIITGPIGIAVAAIGGLIAVGVLLYKNWDTVKATGISVWNGVTNTVSNSINKARDAVKSAIDDIVGFFKNLKLPEFKLPQVKLPHFEIEGKFSLSPPQVPTFGIKWYREGGLMLDPTIFGFDGSSFLAGGESGTGGEAILPLNRLVPIMADAMRSLSVGRGDEFKEIIYLLRQIAAKKIDVYLDGRKLTSGLYDYFDELMTRSLTDERLSRGGAY